MEVHVQEYICHLRVLNQQKDIEINMKHDQINQLLHENQEHEHRLNNIEAEKSTMTERITQLEEELRQERANNLTRCFMLPTVSGRRNYYG